MMLRGEALKLVISDKVLFSQLLRTGKGRAPLLRFHTNCDRAAEGPLSSGVTPSGQDRLSVRSGCPPSPGTAVGEGGCPQASARLQSACTLSSVCPGSSNKMPQPGRLVNNRRLFLAAWGPTSRTKVPEGSRSGEAPPGPQTASSPCVLTWRRGWGSSIRTLNPRREGVHPHDLTS